MVLLGAFFSSTNYISATQNAFENRIHQSFEM